MGPARGTGGDPVKRYRFRLDTVLRVRRLEEETARMRFLEANGALALARSVRDEAEARYRRIPMTLGPCSAEELRSSRQRAELAAATLLARRVAVTDAATEAERVRRLWVGAAGRVRILKRLDERRREEHRLDADREEVRFLDDVGGRMHEDSRVG